MNVVFELLKRITTSRIFNSFIFSLILISAILAGLETYPAIGTQYRALLLFTDQFIIYCFVVEIGLKILTTRPRPWQFFSDPWNVFDFMIVAVCLIPTIDTHFFAVLRIMRILRILRMVTFFPKLRLLIGTLLKSIPSMGYIILLIAILFYVYAIIGVFFFGASDSVHFGDLHHALVTLFKVLTLEGWTDILNKHIYGAVSEGNGQIISLWPFFYFASFILIGAMIIMNLFIGVILNSMQESQEELTKELHDIKFKGKNSEELFVHLISKVEELRTEIQALKKVTDN